MWFRKRRDCRGRDTESGCLEASGQVRRLHIKMGEDAVQKKKGEEEGYILDIALMLALRSLHNTH